MSLRRRRTCRATSRTKAGTYPAVPGVGKMNAVIGPKAVPRMVPGCPDRRRHGRREVQGGRPCYELSEEAGESSRDGRCDAL